MTPADSSADNVVDSVASDLVSMAVDSEVCVAGGQCEMLEPDVFLVDDDTAVAAVVGTGKLSSKRAAALVDRCPSGAISIVDWGGTAT